MIRERQEEGIALAKKLTNIKDVNAL
ncbi:hypothetical protein ACL1EU_12130 [Corynebacterium striatum]